MHGRISLPLIIVLLLTLWPTVAAGELPVFEAMQLPDQSGGAVMLSAVIPLLIGEEFAGQPGELLLCSGSTREAGGPWKACVWDIDANLSMANISVLSVIGTVPPLDETKNSGASDIGLSISDGESLVVVVGYAYDALDRIQPVRWSRQANSMTWMSKRLPTLSGDSGEAMGVVAGVADLVYMVGYCSGVSAEKAVIWTDNGAGGWAVRPLPHAGPGFAGRARDGFVSALAGSLVWGWTESALADTIPVVWDNSGGGWTRTPLPLLPGGAEGMVLNHEWDLDSGTYGLTGWSENSLGDRQAVRWYNDSGWQVEALGILAGYDMSEATSIAVHPSGTGDMTYITGKSYNAGSSVATIWAFFTGPPAQYVRDLNELVMSDNPPVLMNSTGVGASADHVHFVGANGVAGQAGLYSMSQAGDPHAYLLVEVNPVPAVGSFAIVMIIAFTLGAAVILEVRRRKSLRER